MLTFHMHIWVYEQTKFPNRELKMAKVTILHPKEAENTKEYPNGPAYVLIHMAKEDLKNSP